MSAKENITVLGGGLVGSLLSIYLARKGYTVNVFERRPDFRETGYQGGRSINLALSDRGLKGLIGAGVVDAVRLMGIPMHGRMMHDLQGKLTFQPYGKEGQSIYSVSRGRLNEILIEQASQYKNVNFHFNQRCLDVNLPESTVTLENTQNNQLRHIKSDILIGADGAFSALRSAMQKTDRFNYSQHYLEHGYKELTIPPAHDGTHRMEKNALHIWPRGGYMLIALPNIDGSFTCTLFFPFAGETSFASLKTPDAVLSFFQSVFPDAVPLMPDLAKEFFANPTSSLVTVHCSPWCYGDNTLLIGDAAHAIVPFYGQGMNAGFEDCYVLNHLLGKNNGQWEKTLEEFQHNRIQNTNAIAELALQNFVEMRDLVADPKFLLRKKIEARLNAMYPDKWIPLYTMVTFSADIPYSEALRLGQKQEAIMARVMQRPGIEQNWEQLDFEEILNEYEEKIASESV